MMMSLPPAPLGNVGFASVLQVILRAGKTNKLTENLIANIYQKRHSQGPVCWTGWTVGGSWEEPYWPMHGSSPYSTLEKSRSWHVVGQRFARLDSVCSWRSLAGQVMDHMFSIIRDFLDLPLDDS